MIAGIIFTPASTACQGPPMNRSPTPNRAGLFVVHSAVRTSLFGFPLHSGLNRLSREPALEAEYGSAPSAVEWDVLRAHMNFAVALSYSRSVR